MLANKFQSFREEIISLDVKSKEGAKGYQPVAMVGEGEGAKRVIAYSEQDNTVLIVGELGETLMKEKFEGPASNFVSIAKKAVATRSSSNHLTIIDASKL
jgi:hypothetical protein